MNTPLSWIRAYVPELKCTDQEYADAMTLSGTKVEGFEVLDRDLENIVVGKVLKVERHPDAERLVVCQVQIDEAGTTIQIVTGAPNVFEGAIVPVVLDGGKVAGGHDGKVVEGGVKIKKGKLRGIESNGMMCSIEELGSSTNFYPDAAEDGLYIFNDNPEYSKAKLGTSVPEFLGLHDTVVEYEVTSNRVDCFGILGIAREAAATFNVPFVPPVVNKTGNDENVADMISVEIKATDLCKRYVGRVVKDIKLAPSPEWMQSRLRNCGIRPINNIVDITNYVMLEYSQPMHAYDLSTIAGRKIVVKRADEGEKFVTLDGQERILDNTILTICDGEKAVGLAGIMGGENSMITDDVTTMLFEAACFDGTNIRLSSKKLGFRTDASAKFEKGLDPNTAMEAMDRACQLVEELGAGTVVGGSVDVYPEPVSEHRVKFDWETANKHLGTNIDKETQISYFKRVDLDYDYATDEVIVPSWRQDVLRQADLDEEVARFFGYANIPTTLPKSSANSGKLSFKIRCEQLSKDVVQSFGFSESMTYSFESPKVYDKLKLAQEDVLRQAITISNPLGEDYSIMRTLPLNGMLSSLSTNYNRRNKNVKLYEFANIYLPKALPLTELPDERMQLCLGFYGEGDFFTLKGVVEEVIDRLGLSKKPSYDGKAGKNFLHPGRQANIIYDGVVIGYMGEVHPDVADNYSINEKTYVAVLDMPELVSRANFDVKYSGIAKFPAITRDISMLMKKEVTAGDIEAVIEQRGGKLLEYVELFDIYEGAQIKEGYKSMAYSLSFRAADRTLADDEVNAVMKKILNGLSDIGAELRS